VAQQFHRLYLPDLEALASLGILELKVLREAARQAAPDAVRVQLKGLANLLNLQQYSTHSTPNMTTTTECVNTGCYCVSLLALVIQ
jgi:hypothetical protein